MLRPLIFHRRRRIWRAAFGESVNHLSGTVYPEKAPKVWFFQTPKLSLPFWLANFYSNDLRSLQITHIEWFECSNIWKNLYIINLWMAHYFFLRGAPLGFLGKPSPLSIPSDRLTSPQRCLKESVVGSLRRLQVPRNGPSWNLVQHYFGRITGRKHGSMDLFFFGGCGDWDLECGSALKQVSILGQRKMVFDWSDCEGDRWDLEKQWCLCSGQRIKTTIRSLCTNLKQPRWNSDFWWIFIQRSWNGIINFINHFFRLPWFQDCSIAKWSRGTAHGDSKRFPSAGARICCETGRDVWSSKFRQHKLEAINSNGIFFLYVWIVWPADFLHEDSSYNVWPLLIFTLTFVQATVRPHCPSLRCFWWHPTVYIWDAKVLMWMSQMVKQLRDQHPIFPWRQSWGITGVDC